MYYWVVIFSVAIASLAQMLLKKGADSKNRSFIKDYFNVWVIAGYCVLGMSLLLNIFAMRNGVMVKEVGSIEALSYLFVPLFSKLFFKEKINLRKWISIAVIMMGLVVFFQ